MSHRLSRSLLPLVLLSILPGCSDTFDTKGVDLDMVVGSVTQNGQRLTITVTVRNRGRAAVRYTSCPGVSPGMSIQVVNEDGKAFTLEDPCVVFGAPCVEQILASGQHLSATLDFLGSAWDPDADVATCVPSCLPFGRYSAVFRFSYSEDKGVPLRGSPDHVLKKSVPFDWPEEPVDLVSAGTWGGQGIRLTTEACGGAFMLDCGSGVLSRPLILDAEGRFQGIGGVTTGPVSMPYQPITYDGIVDGDSMTLTIYTVSFGPQPASFGPFQLTFGDEGNVAVCR